MISNVRSRLDRPFPRCAVLTCYIELITEAILILGEPCAFEKIYDYVSEVSPFFLLACHCLVSLNSAEMEDRKDPPQRRHSLFNRRASRRDDASPLHC